MGSGNAHPARSNHLRFSGAGRSADAGLRLRSRRETHSRRAGDIAAENYGCAAFLARCGAAVAENGWTDGAGFVAGRPAVQISRGWKARGGAPESGYGYAG